MYKFTRLLLIRNSIDFGPVPQRLNVYDVCSVDQRTTFEGQLMSSNAFYAITFF